MSYLPDQAVQDLEAGLAAAERRAKASAAVVRWSAWWTALYFASFALLIVALLRIEGTGRPRGISSAFDPVAIAASLTHAGRFAFARLSGAVTLGEWSVLKWERPARGLTPWALFLTEGVFLGLAEALG